MPLGQLWRFSVLGATAALLSAAPLAAAAAEAVEITVDAKRPGAVISREGIGPRDRRPVRVNTHWGGVEESNAFGTHEFLNFADLIGADAYVAGNVGNGTPEEMAAWVE